MVGSGWGRYQGSARRASLAAAKGDAYGHDNPVLCRTEHWGLIAQRLPKRVMKKPYNHCWVRNKG